MVDLDAIATDTERLEALRCEVEILLLC